VMILVLHVYANGPYKVVHELSINAKMRDLE